MKGSIRERSPGRWAIILDLYDSVTGERRRKWHSFKGTKRQAQTECSRLITKMEEGDYVEPAKLTLAQFFVQWLEHIKPNVSAKTHERYEQHTRTIGKFIGGKVLSDLQPIHISQCYAKAVQGLAPRTVHHLHRVLYSALGQAERWRIINRNPAALLEKKDRPKIEKKPVTVIDAATAAKVFDAARDGRLFVPLILAILCGLRRGEITALQWKSIDLDRAQLAVVASTEQLDTGAVRDKETKSGKARTIAMPAMVVEELRKWKLAQAEELLRLGMKASAETKVFTCEDGSTMQPHSLTSAMSEFLKPWGMTLHRLRHSHASHLLAANIHPKVVQERLGHSGIGITMDLYSHLMPNMQGEAAMAVDAALRAAINKAADDLE
jgi:integrase